MQGTPGTPDDSHCAFCTLDGRRYAVPAALLRVEKNAELRAKHGELHALLGFQQEKAVFTRTGPLRVCRRFRRRAVVAVRGSEDVVCASLMRREGRFEPGQTYFVLWDARPFDQHGTMTLSQSKH
jgi:hypothetical protein